MAHLLRVNGCCAVKTGRCVSGVCGVVKGNRWEGVINTDTQTQRERVGERDGER